MRKTAARVTLVGMAAFITTAAIYRIGWEAPSAPARDGQVAALVDRRDKAALPGVTPSAQLVVGPGDKVAVGVTRAEVVTERERDEESGTMIDDNTLKIINSLHRRISMLEEELSRVEPRSLLLHSEWSMLRSDRFGLKDLQDAMVELACERPEAYSTLSYSQMNGLAEIAAEHRLLVRGWQDTDDGEIDDLGQSSKDICREAAVAYENSVLLPRLRELFPKEQ